MKEKFGRWNILFVQYLKRDWKKILIWILGLGLFAAGFIPAFVEIAKGDGAIGMFETLNNPAMTALIGANPVSNASEYTIEVMYAHEMLLFSGIFSMVVSMIHVIGHSRREEDLGLTELVRSFQVGRQANSLAIMFEVFIVNVLLALFISGVMLSFKVDSISVEGTFLFGVSIGLAGIMGGAIALVMAQLMPVSSAATGASLGVMGVLYILRGLTDISNISLSMYNPLGWIYLSYPFIENNWLTTIFGLVFTGFLVTVAFVLEGRRDMGAGYLPEKQGRANAKKSLLSIQGLFFRLNKGIIFAWLITFLILGAAYGAIFGELGSFIEGNDLLKLMFSHTGITIEESFTSTIMLVMVGLVSILPIAIVNRLFSEERNLNLSQVFGTKVRRRELYWTNIIIAVVSAIIGMLLSILGLGITATAVMKEGIMSISDFFVIGFNLLPVALFFLGLAALILGWIPKLGKLAYVYLGYSIFINYFGNIINLPNWIWNTSAQNWLPNMPMEEFSLTAYILLIVVSFLLTIIGYFGYKNRDMLEGL